MAVKAVDKRKLGKKIRQLRESKQPRLSQRKLAQEAEITNVSLSDIENGVNFPSEDLLVRLLEILQPTFSLRMEIYDLYANARGTAPPDISAFLRSDARLNELLRVMMQKQMTDIDVQMLLQAVNEFPDKTGETDTD